MNQDNTNKMDVVNKGAYEIVQDMYRAMERDDIFESEICYWQLHGFLHTLDLLGLYDPVQHQFIDRACLNYLDWRHNHSFG